MPLHKIGQHSGSFLVEDPPWINAIISIIRGFDSPTDRNRIGAATPPRIMRQSMPLRVVTAEISGEGLREGFCLGL